MKIKTNEYGKAQYWENTFVAHASGWGVNVIDLYFAPETTQVLSVDKVFFAVNRPDGFTIANLEGVLTTENIELN